MFNDMFEDIAIYSRKFVVDRKKTDDGMVMTMLKESLKEEKDFSVKLKAESVPILLNAGQTTNFIYKVTGITSEQAQQINAIDTKNKIKDRMK